MSVGFFFLDHGMYLVMGNGMEWNETYLLNLL